MREWEWEKGVGSRGKALRLLSLAGHNAVTCGIYWRHHRDICKPSSSSSLVSLFRLGSRKIRCGFRVGLLSCPLCRTKGTKAAAFVNIAGLTKCQCLLCDFRHRDAYPFFFFWPRYKFSAHANVCVCEALKLRMYCNSIKAYLLSSLLRLTYTQVWPYEQSVPIQVWPYASQVRRTLDSGLLSLSLSSYGSAGLSLFQHCILFQIQ